MSFVRLINKDGTSVLVDNSVTDYKGLVDCNTIGVEHFENIEYLIKDINLMNS